MGVNLACGRMDVCRHRHGIGFGKGGMMRGGHTWRALRTLATLLAVSGLVLGMHPAQVGAAAGNRDSRFGLNADIGTRHECDGQQGPAVEMLAQSGAGWVKEEFRWDWV